MLPTDFAGVVALQRLCFPEPFPESHLWTTDHLNAHFEKFPEGQFVATAGSLIVGSCSNNRVCMPAGPSDWEEINGGLSFENFDPKGPHLFGADISVHPEFRRIGIGRRFYNQRFDLVEGFGLKSYVTICRIPGYQAWRTHHEGTVEQYVNGVAEKNWADLTLTPLLQYELTIVGILPNCMDDEESGNYGVRLEWLPGL